ncbi:hypothetical protein [Micromonospora sp. NPDC005174]|uniref:hypothetical protein n=1 Tax=Micromonospora sp. NPDC005174 TaxID=3157018 RepID=UPI0033A3C991
MSRRVRALRRLLVALVAAAVAGVVFALATASIAAVRWDASLAVTAGLAAVFLPQSLIVGAWLASRRRPAPAPPSSDVVERQAARIAALEDHLIFHYDCQHVGRYADGTPLLPDVGDRPDWASLDRKPDVSTAGTSLPAAVSNP